MQVKEPKKIMVDVLKPKSCFSMGYSPLLLAVGYTWVFFHIITTRIFSGSIACILTENINFAFPMTFKKNRQSLFVRHPFYASNAENAPVTVFKDIWTCIFFTMCKIVVHHEWTLLLWRGKDSRRRNITPQVLLRLVRVTTHDISRGASRWRECCVRMFDLPTTSHKTEQKTEKKSRLMFCRRYRA